MDVLTALFAQDVVKNLIEKDPAWLVALVLLLILVWRETAHTNELARLDKSADAFKDFAREAIANADQTYGKRRVLDQKLADGLQKARAKGESAPAQRLAYAIARRVKRTPVEPPTP